MLKRLNQLLIFPLKPTHFLLTQKTTPKNDNYRA